MYEGQEYDEVINSPVGFLGIRFDRQELSALNFLGKKLPNEIFITKKNKNLSRKLKVILDGYFSNPHDVSQPETVLAGTEFQKKVWQILSSIKPGNTRTYGDIARQLGSSPRAVGNACRRNPVPIFIPCHRVVSASGRGGFMGHTSGEPLAIKGWLLAHEQKATAGD
ncbi:MAG: methylated-DNA--[protein]-cysteine S-methyltransferase [Arenicellales bacterium]